MKCQESNSKERCAEGCGVECKESCANSNTAQLQVEPAEIVGEEDASGIRSRLETQDDEGKLHGKTDQARSWAVGAGLRHMHRLWQ